MLRKTSIAIPLSLLLLFSLLSADVLLGDDDGSVYAIQTGTIEGTVTLSGGSGNVEDVEITANGITVHPDSTGYYSIELTPGIYDVTAILLCYQDSTIVGVEVLPEQTTTGVDFTLQQSTGISGHITVVNTYWGSMNVQDIQIAPGVYPDSTGFYFVEMTPGVYDFSISCDGYTSKPSEIEVMVIEGQVTTGVDFLLIDWVPLAGTLYSMIVMANIYLNGEFFDGSGFNMAGAFGTNQYVPNPGTCRSIGVWQTNPTDFWYFTIVSNYQGDDIYFMIYDSETGEVHTCNETVIFWDNTVIGSPTDPFILTAPKVWEQGFALIDNWNWISTYVHPDDPSISEVFAQLGNAVYQVKSQTASATLIDTIWIGDLTELTDGEGYLVQMNEPATLIIESINIIAYNTPINLTTEWNWIAYYPQEAVNLQTALTSIEDNVNQIKNQTQSAINYGGNWYGDLTAMEPGIGYKINMNAEDVLIYNIGK